MKSANLPQARAAAGPALSEREWDRRLLALHGATKTEAFIGAAFRLLASAVKCEWSLAHLHFTSGRAPLLGVDSRGRKYESDSWTRVFSLNCVAHRLAARPGLKILTTSENVGCAVKDEVRVVPFYREGVESMGWQNSVWLFFWDGPSSAKLEMSFSVHRSQGGVDFTAADLAILERAHAHIDTSRRRLKKELADQSLREGMAMLTRSSSIGTVLLDWSLRMRHANGAARRLCALWSNGLSAGTLKLERSVRQPPKQVIEACRAIKKDWAESLRAEPRPRLPKARMLQHPESLDLRATVSLVQSHRSLLGEPAFLVEFQDQRTPATRDAAAEARLGCLTRREREVVLLAAKGLSNKEIATQLRRTVDAVKFALHRTYEKLQIRNRFGLASVAPAGRSRE